MPNPTPSWQSTSFLAARSLQCIISICAVVISYDFMSLNGKMPSMYTFTLACLTAKHLIFDILNYASTTSPRPGKTVLDESVLLAMWAGAIILIWPMQETGCDYVEGIFPRVEACRVFGKGFGFRVVVLEALSLLPTVVMASVAYLYPPVGWDSRDVAWEEIKTHMATAWKHGI